MPLKHDADSIQAFMQGLASTLGLDDKHRWWPNWLYRSDHAENAAEILNSGELLSRSAAELSDRIVKDSASQQHVDELTESQRSYVRLYFRPRTPTQYRNEGIRPDGKIWNGAHMPVPVYLLFGSQLLQETGVRFCEGRLMPSAQIGDSAEFLSKMNFREIYHDGQLYQHNRANIINARNSEVLIKNRLPLDLLRHIVCRSSPERDTLLNLLGPAARKRWMQRLRVDDGHRRLFYKDMGTFIKDVHLSGHGSRITFHLCTEELRGPFHLRIEWKGKSNKFTYEQQDFEAPETPLEVEFPDGVIEPEYEVTLRLNDDVAYVGKFGSKDSLLDPF